MRAYLFPAHPVGRLYRFAWWAKVWGAVMLPVTAALAITIAIIPAWLFLDKGFLGWIIAVPFFIWVVYFTTLYFSIFTPVLIAERGFYVRILLRWYEIPWQNVSRMSYIKYPFHYIYVRQRLPLRKIYGSLLFKSSEVPVFLVIGLEHRKELFWKIWHQASRAQGREVPVRFARPPRESD